MEFIPHILIEGMIVSAYALGSNVSYIYIRGEYAWIIDILEQAIAEAKQHGFLGKNILGSGFDCEMYVHRGAGAYICGEARQHYLNHWKERGEIQGSNLRSLQ